MDERLVRLIEVVDSYGLDYALTKWSDWEQLSTDYPELFYHIFMYRWFSECVEERVGKLKKELANE